MEWIVTEARTVADAKESALDQLGVDEHEAEFEVLAEPQRGVLGFGRANAQVRARVMPRVETPLDRRNRPKRTRGGRRPRADGPKESRTGTGPGGTKGGPPAAKLTERRVKRSTSGGHTTMQAKATKQKTTGGKMNLEDLGNSEAVIDPEHEEELVQEFTSGLVTAINLDATVTTTRTSDGALEVVVEGDDVGLLIGRRGTTLSSVEELLRVIVQRHRQGRRSSKVRLEVGGYRQRRQEALEAFARRIATEVVESGKPKILEPMNAADRKIVHDAIVEMSGVNTASEGEEPRRRVVVQPGS